MNGRVAWFALGLLLSGCALSVQARAGTAGNFTVGIEPSYFVGHYGTSRTIQIYDLPLSVEYQADRLRLRIELPYIAITGSGLVIGATAISAGHRADFRSGPGDVWLQAAYRLTDANGIQPSVEAYTKFKLPLASYSNGLGTGRPDEEFGGRLSWGIGGRVFLFARLGYRAIGKVPSLHLQDIITFAPGATIVAAKDQYVTALISGHSPIQQHRPSAVSLILAYNVRINPRWELQAYLTHGLTPGSATFGAGAGVLTHF